MIWFLILFNLISMNILFKCELISVAIIHRHGDRTPIESYSYDKYGTKFYWPDGWGQLLKKGKVRMYELGLFLRQRYSNIMSDNIREIHIQSSDKDRCLESASLVSAGAYMPKGRWIWREDLKWVPIAIHTRIFNEDGLLGSPNCPKIDEEYEKVKQQQEYIEFLKNYEELFSFLSHETKTTVNSLEKVRNLYDIFLIESQNGYNWPEWLDNGNFTKMREATNFLFHTYYYTKTLQRLKTGLLFGDIRKRFQNLRKQDDQELPKILLYSTHDTHIAGFLIAINAYNEILPPYGATILVELWSNENGENIKFLYLNDTENYKIFNLDVDYDWATFETVVNSLEPFDWINECGIHRNIGKYVIISAICIGFTMCYLYFCHLRKKSKVGHFFYQLVPMT